MSFIRLTLKEDGVIFIRCRAICSFFRENNEDSTVVEYGDASGDPGVVVLESPDDIAAKIAECEKGRTRKHRDDQPVERKQQTKRREMASHDEVAMVGARLFNYRTTLRLTCKQISSDSGIPKATLYDVESAATREPRRRVAKATIDSVAQYLDRAEDEFIRDGMGGTPKTIGLYCCSIAGVGIVRRQWNGANWILLARGDDLQSGVIAWQFLGRHAR